MCRYFVNSLKGGKILSHWSPKFQRNRGELTILRNMILYNSMIDFCFVFLPIRLKKHFLVRHDIYVLFESLESLHFIKK